MQLTTALSFCAGGTHHAHRTHGSGFCILNDLAFTAEKLIRIGAVKRVLVVDLDVHQVAAKSSNLMQSVDISKVEAKFQI